MIFGDIGLFSAFRSSIVPIFMEIGKVLLYVSVFYGAYHIIRSQYTKGVEKIKWAAIGYIMLQMTDAFVSIIDKIAQNMRL